MDGTGPPMADDLWALVHFVQSLIRPDAQELAQQGQKVLVAEHVAKVSTDPNDPSWRSVTPTYVALMHLWWNDKRADGLLVRAAHDGKRIAFQLTWEDGTMNDDVLRQDSFSDAAAIQLSPSLDPPLFTMGSKESQVHILQWKAHWQKGVDTYQDIERVYPNMAVDQYPGIKNPTFGDQLTVEAVATAKHRPIFMTGWSVGNLLSTPGRKSAVESLAAKGFGTLRSLPATEQSAEGHGQWEDRFWQITLVRDLAADGALPLTADKDTSIAFAIWDGGVGDRNGQKSVTIWHRIKLETK
jgi:hypothetical protein